MSKQIDWHEYERRKQAAKSIKADLKLRWPEVAFTVRSYRFAGGSSVCVSYPEGPPLEAIYQTVERYEEGIFDTQDCYIYKTDPAGVRFREINGGAKYVICRSRKHREI